MASDARFRHTVAVVWLVLGISVPCARAQSALDGFDPGANGEVYALAVQPDGRIVVGGAFTMLGGGGSGSVMRHRIGRLNVDGSIDATFNPEANSTVWSLAVQPDGKILAGGWFTMIGGSPRRYIARLNADGSIDASFNPGANGNVVALEVQPDGKIVAAGGFTALGGGATTPRNRIGRLNTDGSVDAGFDPGQGADGFIRAMALQPDGKIVVGGNFTTLCGNWRNRIGRLNADGSLDLSFYSGASYDVYSVAVQADGKILVGGNFRMLGEAGLTRPRNFFGRLNPDGSPDPWFNPIVNSTVYDLAVQHDGKILAVGLFTRPLGTPRSIARFNADGSLDAAFDTGVVGWSDYIWTVAVQPDGKILAGGGFAGLGRATGPSTPRRNIARLYADGSVDADLNPTIDSGVRTVAIQPDGKILVGGAFSMVAGTSRRGIARINADGSLDTSFDPDADAEVSAIVVQPDGKIVVGGRFTRLGSGKGAAQRYFIGRLNADGSVDSSFNPGADNHVTALALQPDGQIVVGGLFTGLGGGKGATPRNFIGRLDADGWVDPTFGPRADGFVYTIALQEDEKILVGGSFRMLNWDRRNSVGRLNGDGSLDASFNPGTNGRAYALALQPDGKILVAGDFSMLGGGTGTTPRRGIGRLDADGAVDSSFDPGATDVIVTMALQSDGKILVGGQFTALGGGSGVTPRNRLGRLDADGSVDLTFDPGADGIVFALAVQPDGKIVVGGGFTALGGGGNGTTPRQYLGRLTNTGVALETLSVTDSGSRVIWSRGGTAPEVARVTFESSSDGRHYTSLGTPTRSSGGWTLAGLNIPSRQTLFIRARGYAATGYFQGSGSLVESIREVYIANTPPTISPIATVVVRRNAGSFYVEFTARDRETGVTVSAVSSNQTLAPTSLLFINNGFLTYSLSGTLAYNQFGRTTITITASDGMLSTATSFNVVVQPYFAGDIDRDDRADFTVYQPSSGTWHVVRSSGMGGSDIYMGGDSSDIPVPGDYDGDGAMDLALYRRSSGAWSVLWSSANFMSGATYYCGQFSDTPVPGDYDGDGKTDPAVYRRATGEWFILQSSQWYYYPSLRIEWGNVDDVPVPGDYDGDGKTDVAAWNPSNGIWSILKSTSGNSQYFTVTLGASTDIPVAADYDGDAKHDVAVFRPSTGTWHILLSTTNYTTPLNAMWGASGDIPVPGDYDGDHRTDIAVFRPFFGAWLILKSSSDYTTSASYTWGTSGGIPVLGR